MKMLLTRVPYVLTIAPGLHFYIGAVTSGQRFVDVLHGHVIVTSWKFVFNVGLANEGKT